MTGENSELLTDSEMAELLRSLETHSQPNSGERERLLNDMLSVFDGVNEADDPRPSIATVIDDEVTTPRKASTLRTGEWFLAAAAVLALAFWVSRPDVSNTAVTASETTDPVQSGPTSQSDDPGTAVRFSNFGDGIQLPLPDGITVVEETSDRISFTRSADDLSGSAAIVLIATGTTDIDQEIERLVDDEAIVVNDSRVRVGDQLRSRWEVTISNTTAADLDCVGIQPCLIIPTDGADVVVWSGIPTIITSLDVDEASHAVWLVRLTSYQDARGRTVSGEMLNGLEFG